MTGAAQGIGRGIASVLGAEGARVVLCDLDAELAESTATSLREDGIDALAIATDVTNRASVAAMASRVVAEHGRIDILAANAGIYPPAELATIDDATWDKVMDVNATGAVRAVQTCMTTMVSRGYGASKAAMLGFMRSAAVELATSGVTVNAVLPGNVQTPGFADTSEEHQRRMLASIPMRRYAEPEEIGWAVRFLASPEAAYITGQTLIVDGGQVLPEGPLQA